LAWAKSLAPQAPRLNLAGGGGVDFFPPDGGGFPALGLGREGPLAGAGAPTVLSAANEVAVVAVLAGKIGFLDIAAIVETVLTQIGAPAANDLAAVLALDNAARDAATRLTAAMAA